jgi:hypothetical protein
LEKPLATKTSSTERPTAFNGAAFEEAERALGMSEPRTPVSIRGVIPRRASEVGRLDAADGWDVDIEVVEVLLCGHETYCDL